MPIREPNIPIKTNFSGVDKPIDTIKTILSNLSWISHPYGRAYRILKIQENQHAHFASDKFTNVTRNTQGFYPQIHQGTSNGVVNYFDVSPDNKKKGQFFFVVGNQLSDSNFNKVEVSIIFSVNLEMIDPTLLLTDIFTEKLIDEVKKELRHPFIKGVTVETLGVDTEFKKVFDEYTLREQEQYMVAPLQCFRFNTIFSYQTVC